MRIGLLAPESNGKSSYLVALYGVLINDRNIDTTYPMHYSVKNDVQKLELNEKFRKLADETKLAVERFPKKTLDGVVEYVFTTTHKSSGLAYDVTIVDFSGELLRGATSDGERDLYNSLQTSLSGCDAFIVLLDSTFVVEGSKYAAMGALSPNDINQMISAATASSRNKEFSNGGVPVAFCVSKFDKLGTLHAGQAEAIATSYKKVSPLFPRFFSESCQNPVMITGTSLGEHIEPGPNGLAGALEPFMIGTPFEFAVFLGAHSAAQHNLEKWKEHSKLYIQAEVNANKMAALGLVRNVALGLVRNIDVWMSTPGIRVGEFPVGYWKRKAREHKAAADAAVNRYHQFRNISRDLSQYVNKSDEFSAYSMYYAGVKQKIKDSINYVDLWPLAPVWIGQKP